jgi:hypothetical protein
MHCWSLGEKAKLGIAINREEHPHITVPEGCPLMLMLDKELTEFTERIPPGVATLERAGIVFEHGVMVLKNLGNVASTRQALVRIETAGGVNGKVRLTAEAYDDDMQHGEGKKLRHPFPPPGVEAICTDEWKNKYRKGVDILDLFVIMSPKTSFRIERDGQLEGASPEMFVRWTGATLFAEVPRRYRDYEERDTGAFAVAAS